MLKPRPVPVVPFPLPFPIWPVMFAASAVLWAAMIWWALA